MHYDLDFRYRRALTPNCLSSVEQYDRAISEAEQDALLAGLQPDQDPGVALLRAQRHALSADTHVDTAFLEAACLKRLTDLEKNPAIIAIVRSGATAYRQGQRHFRYEARMTIREIAKKIGIPNPDAQLLTRSSPGNPDEISLQTADITIEIYGYRWNADHAIAFWSKNRRTTRPIEALSNINALCIEIADFISPNPDLHRKQA